MDRFHGFVLSRPRTVLALILLGWLALLLGLTRLEIATDGRALVSPEAPAVGIARAIDNEFGVGDELVLVVESRDTRGIWNTATLRRLCDLARGLALVDGVDAKSIQSLATERGDRVLPGTLETIPWFEPWPETPEQLAALRTRIERVDLYRGTLISVESPARSASIVFRLESTTDRRAGCAVVQAWLATQAVPESDVYLVGAALAESRLGDHLLDDLARLVPGALLLMGAVLLARFRSPWAALLPLMGVGFVLTATFGLIGLAGARIYLTLLVLPVVLTVVGVADAIHLLDDYFGRVAANPRSNRKELLRETMAQQWRSLLAAELTTALGFISFAFSPLPPVRVFGTFATLGVALYTVWSLVGLPAALVLLESRGLVTRRVQSSRAGRAWLGERCRALAGLSLRRPRTIVAVTLIAVALCAHGISLVRVEDSWLNGFARSSTTYRDTQHFEAGFAGVHTLRIRVDARAVNARGRIERKDVQPSGVFIPDHLRVTSQALLAGRLRLVPVVDRGSAVPATALDLEVVGYRPVAGGAQLMVNVPHFPLTSVTDVLPPVATHFDYELLTTDRLCAPQLFTLVGELELILEDQSRIGVSRVLGPRGHMRSLDAMLGTGPEVGLRRTRTREGIVEALDLYDRGRGKARRTEFWNEAGDRALITVLVRDASYVTVGELMKRIRGFEQERLAPAGLTLEFGGDLALNQTMIQGIVHTQVGSLLGSVLGNAVVIALALLSLRFGLISAIPCAFAVAANFALMGWAGISLGVATSMFAAMTIGVGVDWAIHVVRALRLRLAGGADVEAATHMAFMDVGPAVVVDAGCVGLGFGLMLSSSVPPTRHLGLMLVASLATCLVATLVILPALFVLVRPRRP